MDGVADGANLAAQDPVGRNPGDLLQRRVPDDVTQIPVNRDDAVAGAGDDGLGEGGPLFELRDVVERDCELARPMTVGTSFVMAAEGGVVALQLIRGSGQGDVAEPHGQVPVQSRHHLAGLPADHVHGVEAGELLERRVDVHEA